jgi:hypothetical protein
LKDSRVAGGDIVKVTLRGDSAFFVLNGQARHIFAHFSIAHSQRTSNNHQPGESKLKGAQMNRLNGLYRILFTVMILTVTTNAGAFFISDERGAPMAGEQANNLFPKLSDCIRRKALHLRATFCYYS